jgi:hypothetical protein
VEDLDRQVLATFSENFLELLAKHLACPVMRVHDVVADLELDVDYFRRRLEIV